MNSRSFVQELEAWSEERLAELGEITTLVGDAGPPADLVRLLKVALANEISVSELAAVWMPSTAEWEIKIALAQQGGDEARHFNLVEGRLSQLGVSLADFAVPDENELFAYLKSLQTSVEKVAAGPFMLELIAYKVNDNFIHYCERFGDPTTVSLYTNFIQPDELHHHHMGRMLLEKYAITPDAQRLVREAAAKTFEMTADLRRRAAQKLGTNSFPGC